MRKIILLLTLGLLLTGCGAEPISGNETNETSYYIQDSELFDIYVDERTCVEYIIFNGAYKGGIIPRLNIDDTLKLNESCLKNKE